MPEANEAVLAGALDLKNDALSIQDGLSDTHVDGAGDGGTRLIEGQICGDLHVTLIAVGVRVVE